MREIPLSKIDCAHFRIHPESGVNNISESLLRIGQLSPIRLRKHPGIPGMYQVVFGNRRVLAAMRLGWKTIRAEVVNSPDEDSILVSYAENADREDFSDYEKALLFEKFHQTSGKSYSEIARLIGKSPAFVSQHIAMLHLFPKSKDSNNEREEYQKDQREYERILCGLSEKQARALAKVYDLEERWSLAKLAVDQKIGAERLEQLCSKPRTKSKVEASSLTTIRLIIESMLNGFNSKDVSFFTKTISKTHFSLFSSFPPYSGMDHDTALDHICAMLRKMDSFRALKIDDIQIRISGKIAYAVMVVTHEFCVQRRKVETKMRATIILEKKEESWKIVHVHWSPSAPAEFLSLLTSREVPRLSINEIGNL